jgi:hypothetical protein
VRRRGRVFMWSNARPEAEAEVTQWRA